MVRNARARVALEAGDAAQAAELAAVDSPFPLHAAEAHLIRGRALGDAGDLTAAQAVPGAVRLHDEAARELRRLGRAAPGPSAPASPAASSQAASARSPSSSPRACSNREIGAALFLSEKTVEGHLTNVFAKLGVRSRVALAARYVSAGAA